MASSRFCENNAKLIIAVVFRLDFWVSSSTVEQMSYTHPVPGSNPGPPTKNSIASSAARRYTNHYEIYH